MKAIDKKEIAQNKILDAAYEVFVGKGTQILPWMILLKSLKYKGAIYHYYSSKKALF